MKSLKIPNLACMAVVLLILCGCSDDEGSGPAVNMDVVGQWDLIEVNISTAQDIDQDGTPSTNLLEELNCISGTLTINADESWSFQQSDISITSITNNQFFAECSGTTNGIGTWTANAVQVIFVGSSALNSLQIGANNTLINNIGENLPGIQSLVYQQR